MLLSRFEQRESHFLGPKGLRSVVDVVQLVAVRRKVTVREVCEVLGLARSTGHRLVAALASVRFIQREGANGTYVLGSLVGELAGGPLAWRTLVLHCRPHMEALRDSTGETIALHALHADRRVQLDQAESKHELRWVSRNTLVPMPLHAGAAGKVLLALLPEADMKRLASRDNLVAFTRRTPRDTATLLREMGRIRMQRYAISLEEVQAGITSLAVPVVSESFANQPLAVMSLTGPVVRLPEKNLKSLLPKLQVAAKRAADGLERALGGRTEAA